MNEHHSEIEDPKFLAAVDLLKRTGAAKVHFRHSEVDQPPVSWTVVAEWHPTINPKDAVADAGGGMTPMVALMRLCESVIDGGTCQHCKKVTIFDHTAVDPGPLLEQMGCVYSYDPELKKFRRGCE